MRVGLIDGDILCHQASSRVERPVEWGDGLFTLHANLDEAMARLDGYVEELQEKVGADQVVMALSSYDGDRWRNDILPSYKEDREPKRKPTVYFPLREYVQEVYETWERPRLEGDDVLGILATHPGFKPKAEKVVLSIDKDLKTIPGLHINWRHARKDDEWVPKEITENEADYFFMLQTLMGDRTDGYKGVPGIGPKRGARLLEEGSCIEEWWPTVRQAYEDAGIGPMALKTAQVARILRASDYDYDRKRVVPWTPPPVESVE